MEKGLTRWKAERQVRRARSNQMLEGVLRAHVASQGVPPHRPQGELEILFPNARIRFTQFDRLWFWFGSGGSAAFAAIVMAVLKFILALVVIGPGHLLWH